MLPRDRQCVIAVATLKHRVAMSTERVAHQSPHCVVIFGEKNRLRPARDSFGDDDVNPRLDRRVHGREVDGERRATTDLTIDPKKSPTLRDDAVDGRQSEPGTFAEWLRGEERLKYVRLCLRGHSDAGVTDSQPDIPTRHQRW